jgi:hypothetical protein
MDTQYKSFQTVLDEELGKIEKAFVLEREEMLINGRNDIAALMEKRKQSERSDQRFI